MKKFDEYQAKILEFMNPRVMQNERDILENALFGLAGESGEACDFWKKVRFHDQEPNLEQLDKEIGDIVFYCALYANARKKLLSDIVQMNVDKLTKRYDGKPWSAEASKAKRDETPDRLKINTSGTVTSPDIEITSIT